MKSGKSPDIRYNKSGYLDLTAHTAITNADREQLKMRRNRVMEQIYKIARAEGFRIGNHIKLIEIEEYESDT